MNILFPKEIINGILSSPKEKKQSYIKAKIKKVLLHGQEVFQISYFTQTQAFHTNIKIEELPQRLNQILEKEFNCLEIQTKDYHYNYRVTGKGKVLTNRKAQKHDFITLEHNKKKNYKIQEGEIVPPLIDLGIMTKEGQVVKSKFDKFKQINRFLEMIEDSIVTEKELRIIDFGCGKSYLTFILYYYLTEVKKIHCEILGLDLKDDVVKHCNEIAEKYRYNNLHFLCGDIAKYSFCENVDMIVTLHACDTATDYALYYAIKMKCKYIFSVPCCQHEINAQIKSSKLPLIGDYGLLKERFSALLTDAIRANILKYYGYKTQILEFVDWDATPKNVLIRASLTGTKVNPKYLQEVEDWLKDLEITPTLYELIKNDK